MISDIIWWGTVSWASISTGVLVAPKIKTWAQMPGFHKGGLTGKDAADGDRAVEVGPKNLSEAHIRERMTEFLRVHEITGDADVRMGRFFAPVPVSKLEPLAITLRKAWERIGTLKNRNACSLYIRDSENDRFLLLDELDLNDIGEMLRVMERIVADRRKSRSLYKGMTDEEIRKFAVAATSRWLKDHGEFDQANVLAEGHWTQYIREIGIASAALELAFQVKRPEA